jgi:hypothetical protein
VPLCLGAGSGQDELDCDYSPPPVGARDVVLLGVDYSLAINAIFNLVIAPF